MGLLDETTNKNYYQGNDFGSYQFISLEDIISQFMVVYVGDQKIISKASRIDVAFHAQRALQELSFDTLKSVKSQQIDLPPTLVMPLPHDYVNYTKLSWSDSAGIKHPLYPTNSTSNPFQIMQEDDGNYSFPEELELVVNGDFSAATLSDNKPATPWYRNSIPQIGNYTTVFADFNIINEALTFSHRTRATHGDPSGWGHAVACWQLIDVSDQDYVDISATGTAGDMANGPGVLRFGLSTNPGDSNTKNLNNQTYADSGTNHLPGIFDLVAPNGVGSYIEWRSSDGAGVSKELLKVDVKAHNTIYVLIVSYQEFSGINETLTATNVIDNLSVTNSYASTKLQPAIGNETESSTWNSYKSGTPSENQDDYQDDTYWPMDGSRYGLDPQHAQANGSFYIDPRLGKIHFSSNISGKTVILDYISDSLGTDSEMQVHKFAEEAMYRWIAHAIIAGRANVPEYQVSRFKKERFAAVRTAKLRLSNIKLEELTQILRGKSKQIKH
tara:strand:+ start:1536 stop:3032 length:1497 start_codon:yes stop_codon:yes gene_type:complete